MEILKKFEGIIDMIIDFVMAIVKVEFPEIGDVLGE